MIRASFGDEKAKQSVDRIGVEIAGSGVQRKDRKERKQKRKIPKAKSKRKSQPKREILGLKK